jgi:hypothetical protein
MQRLWEAFKNLSPVAKVIFLLVAAAAIISIFQEGQSCASKRADARFDKREAEREQQRQTLETEREQAVGRAQAAEQRARDLEQQTKLLELTIEAAGQRAEIAKEAIENENQKLNEELIAIDTDVDSCERVNRLCARLQKLKIYPANKECLCQ